MIFPARKYANVLLGLLLFGDSLGCSAPSAVRPVSTDTSQARQGPAPSGQTTRHRLAPKHSASGGAAAPTIPPPPRQVHIPIRLRQRRIIWPGKIRFVDRRAVLTQSAIRILVAISRALRARPRIALVRIVVHTDTRGTLRWNDELSRKRAQTIERYLVQQGGVGPSRLQARGLGKRYPLCQQHTSACNAQNERVEMWILQRRNRAAPAATGSRAPRPLRPPTPRQPE